jgi:hypothetical protein
MLKITVEGTDVAAEVAAEISAFEKHLESAPEVLKGALSRWEKVILRTYLMQKAQGKF